MSASSLAAVLSKYELTHMEYALTSMDQTLSGLESILEASGRTAFLNHLKTIGISALNHRQALANAIAKSKRERQSASTGSADAGEKPQNASADSGEKALEVWALVPDAIEQDIVSAISAAGGNVEQAVEILKRPKAQAAAPKRASPVDVSDTARTPRDSPRQVSAAALSSQAVAVAETRMAAAGGSSSIAKDHNAAVAAASSLPYEAHALHTESKYRLLATIPAHDGKEPGSSQLIEEVEEGTTVTVVEEVICASGDRRVRIIDPVWQGWLTRRVARTAL